MGYLIVTARSLLWMLASLVATLLMLGALMSPVWLVANQQSVRYDNETILYTPSVGVYTKCSKPIKFEKAYCTAIAVRGLATESYVYPSVWKAATVFLITGIMIMSATVFMSLISCCVQSLFKKSIFTMSGVAQAFAGICFILGVMLHPMGWGATRVQKLCGREASPFYPADCSLGLGLVLAAIGTILAFVSACLSVPAEKSTSSDTVQDQIYEGQTLICLA
jgi:hypothetical protein